MENSKITSRNVEISSKEPIEISLLLKGEKLNISQITSLFQEDNYNPGSIRVIKEGLFRSLINPDEALLASIYNSKSNKSLLPIGLCLRLANANMYVRYEGVSDHIHLLGYAFLVTKRNIQDSIIILLILAGSSLNKPIFDENRGGIQNERDILSQKYITVERWLYSQNYVIVKEYNEKGLTNIPQKNLDLFKVLLDEYANIDNELLIKSLGNNIAKVFKPTDLSVLWMSIDLNNSIKYYNVEIYRKTEKSGYTITYPMMNDLILKALKNKDNSLLLSDLREMISISISNGYEFDIHQLTLLQNLDSNLVNSLRSEYSIPLWKKACRNEHLRENSSELPLSVKRNVIGANIPLNSGTCGYLETMDKTDLKELISASQAQKSAKLISDMSIPSDYIGKSPNSVSFSNSDLLRSSANNYGDMYEVHYIDSRGKKWIFTSELFETLLESRLNPVTLEKLPNNILDNISFRKKLLDQLGIPLDKPVTLEESLTKLREPDVVSSGDENYLHILQTKGINVNLEKLKNIDTSKLKKVNIDVNLENLTKSHISTTILWILSWISKVKPELLSFVVQELDIV